MAKRVLLLISVALALVFGVSAVAFAEEYRLTDEGNTITEHTDMNIQGNVAFNTGGSGPHCDYHAYLTTSNGVILSATLDITTQTCTGFGLYSGCKVIDDDSNGPHEVHLAADGLVLTDVFITLTHNGSPDCLFSFTHIFYSPMLLSVDDSEAISGGNIDGEGALDNDFGEELAVSASGSFEVVGGDAERFGIETF